MRVVFRNRRLLLLGAFGVLVTLWLLHKLNRKFSSCDTRASYDAAKYSRDMPLIFIGGVPRSGTTLMRAMLDAHPDVRCGQETRVIPRILQLRSHWMKSEKESLRLREAGITPDVLNEAIAQFSLEIIVKHGEPASRYCNKDPLTLKMGTYVMELFPNAKFLFMVRDGRGTVHSIISRKVTITGFDLTSYRQCMIKWNQAIETMYNQCNNIGKDQCKMVYYEKLVMHPEEQMREILDFLNITWNESVLHHEEMIGKKNGVALSKVERSSDQVIKPINLEALSKWEGQFPDDVVRDMPQIAPMLRVLGYNPYENKGNYGDSSAWVKENTHKIKEHPEVWDKRAKQLLKQQSHNNDNKNNDDDKNNQEPNSDTNNELGVGGADDDFNQDNNNNKD